VKIDDYELRGLPQELIDFKDDVITILNFGKYAQQVINGSPGWDGREGESVFYVDTAANATFWYVYSDSSWTSVGITPASLKAAIQFDGNAMTVTGTANNITTVTRDANGQFTVTYGAPFARTDYVVGGMCNGTYLKLAGTATDLRTGFSTFKTGDGSNATQICFFAGGEI